MNIKMKYLLLCLFLVFFATNCNPDYKENNIKKAISSTKSVHSCHVYTTVKSIGDININENKYELEFASNDRFRQKSGCPGCGIDNWYEIISINDTQYFHNADRPDWYIIQSPDEPSLTGSVPRLTPPQEQLDNIIEPLNWLKEIDELADDAYCNHCLRYSGTVDMDLYLKAQYKNSNLITREATALHDAMRKGTRIVEVWIDKDSYLIQQIRSKECYVVADVTGVKTLYAGVTTTTFKGFNSPISVEPPVIK